MPKTAPVPRFKLPSGDTMPGIGLGTWRCDLEEARAAVLAALNAGYRYAQD
jgi:diketogulonate reductase-like aldo/keto reductase